MKMKMKNCEIADNILKQIIGLMFNWKNERNILFKFDKEGNHPIHSFFVFQNFVALYLDKNKKIIQINKVKPFTKWIESKKPARYLFETTNKKIKFKIGDVIECSDGKLPTTVVKN